MKISLETKDEIIKKLMIELEKKGIVIIDETGVFETEEVGGVVAGNFLEEFAKYILSIDPKAERYGLKEQEPREELGGLYPGDYRCKVYIFYKKRRIDGG